MYELKSLCRRLVARVDVLPFVVAADVIGFPYPSFIVDQVQWQHGLSQNESRVIQPVSVDRQRLVVAYIVDHQGDQLLEGLW